jgi:hypothetical protein
MISGTQEFFELKCYIICSETNKATPWSRELLEKLTLSQK